MTQVGTTSDFEVGRPFPRSRTTDSAGGARIVKAWEVPWDPARPAAAQPRFTALTPHSPREFIRPFFHLISEDTVFFCGTCSTVNDILV